MKVITKHCLFEGQDFVLIQDHHEGRPFWGTIPRSALDSEGRMIRPMNGVEMRISWVSAGDALNNRRIDVALSRLIDGFKAQGMDLYEALAAVVETEEYQALYA